MIDKDALRNHVAKQFEESQKFTVEKREIFRDRIKLYNQEYDHPNRIYNNILYSNIQAQLAIRISDEPEVEFVAKTVGDEEYASNLTFFAKSDYQDMDMQKANIQKAWYELMFGVGIRLFTGFNVDENKQMWEVVDPLTWYPDVMFDQWTPARYQFFDRVVNVSDMTAANGYDTKAVSQMQRTLSQETQEDISIRNEARRLNVSSGLLARDDLSVKQTSDITSVIYGFTKWKGKKYCVVLDSAASVLLKAQVLEEEYENDFLYVNVSWFSPLPNDPFGVAFSSILADKQIALSQLENLQLKNAQYSVLGSMNFFDPTIVNKNDIANPGMDSKWIPYDSSRGQRAQDSVYRLPRESTSPDAFAMIGSLRSNIQIETGMDNRTLGISGDSSITKGEAQQIQENANLRLSLNTQIDNWGDQDFWEKWLQIYRKFWNKAIKRKIRVISPYGSFAMTIKRKDIQNGDIPYVFIRNRKLQQARNAQQAKLFLATLPLLQNDPNIPQVSKRYAQRKSLLLQGMQHDQVLVLIPKTADELDAEIKLKAINENLIAFPAKVGKREFGGEKFLQIPNPLQADLQCYFVIWSQAQDNESKLIAMDYITNAIIISGQNRQTEQNNQAQVNSAQASLMANATSTQGGVQSLQSIAQ